MFQQLSSFVRLTGTRALNILVPPLCIGCDEPATEAHALCSACWRSIEFLTPLCCDKCGAPFDVTEQEGMLCAACHKEPPAYDKARAAMIYDDASKGLVLRFKHGDATWLAPSLARWIQQAGQGFWPEIDALIPVPLHRRRLFDRRYNQAAMLALETGRLVGKPAYVDVLCRSRATESQGKMNRRQRQENVKGAFTVSPRWRDKIAEKTLALVDDVMTTGATVEACANVLKKAGAKAVIVLTLARVRTSV